MLKTFLQSMYHDKKKLFFKIHGNKVRILGWLQLEQFLDGTSSALNQVLIQPTHPFMHTPEPEIS
jgi:hypothetical protein